MWKSDPVAVKDTCGWRFPQICTLYDFLICLYNKINYFFHVNVQFELVLIFTPGGGGGFSSCLPAEWFDTAALKWENTDHQQVGGIQENGHVRYNLP